ncbi:T9SS type A sorting domain-containing protein [Pedobacter ureilyticus]|uniref:T9SS type A sorting domain-containing protein n=1 Tax=Pedobacter ureilyticus TaxID=1393051 RepID=A0ABW9J9Z1_9SPHI|nr:T9SS type A sorting domain-containing protein [Pedobacter helvus]
MKKLLLFLLFSAATHSFTKAQFSENMGNPASTTVVSSYTGWQNNGMYTYAGTADVRTSSSSTGYLGASAAGNVFITNTLGRYFSIAGINTVALTNPAIEFGLFKNTTASDATDLTFEYSTNGTDFTAIPIPAQSTGGGTANWRLIRLIGLPNTSTLTIRFTNSGTATQFRLDDIQVNSLSVLPVTLTSFTAKANLQNIDLTWSTASEKDNARFDVLRSGDGKTFHKIGEVKGNGTTDVAHNYTFVDKDALPGVSYYQLNQVDFNGNVTPSAVEAVKSNVAASNFKVTSNKQEGIVKLTVFAANEGKATFKVYDINGRKVKEKELSLNKGYSQISVPFNSANGLHIASLTTATETVTQKFIQ